MTAEFVPTQICNECGSLYHNLKNLHPEWNNEALLKNFYFMLTVVEHAKKCGDRVCYPMKAHANELKK